MPHLTVPQAISRVRRGDLVVVVDGPDRENEGDVTLAAEHATAAKIGFMITQARGLVCMPCDGDRLDDLGIGPMVAEPDVADCAAFGVSIDHRETSSGISATDRALTITRACDPSSRPSEFVRPGHVFPLRSRPGGVLERPGHTEAAVDLMRLAGLRPCAVICEVLNDDGSVARLSQLEVFARRHRIGILSVEDLVAYRNAAGASPIGAGRTSRPTDG